MLVKLSILFFNYSITKVNMKSEIKLILELIKSHNTFDFSGNQMQLIEKLIQKRVAATKNNNLNSYLEYLKLNTNELDILILSFTINVSWFFRNPLTFEYLSNIILPDYILNNKRTNNKSLRIWSAGCAEGEEVYTIAIIINEILKEHDISITPDIFATDIDKKALKIASKGKYNSKSLKEVKYNIIEKYFNKKDKSFEIIPEIKEMVRFSFYDLLNLKSNVPPESIYGDFDIVFCRNVLIYFKLEYQELIFEKLYNSLKKGAYLVLGETEFPIGKFQNKFKHELECCKVFRKIG